MPNISTTLLEESSLTYKQVETILLSKRVKNHEITVREAGQMKPSHAVQPGSYYRILDQARKNLRETAFTLLLAARLQMLNMEDMSRLVSMVREAPEEMSEESLRQFMAVVEQLVRRLVTV